VYVGREDQAALLACFDDTAAIVFSVLCQLCAGDADLAVELLGDTYGYLARTAASSYGVDVDRRWMIDAAHSVYAARAPEGRNEIGPVAALATRDRVVVRLHDVEHRGPSEIGMLLGATIDDIERSLAAGRALIATSTVAAFQRGDVWFDDDMRAKARTRIGGPPAPAEPDDQPGASADDPSHILMSRRTMVGASATASIAALIGLGLWFGSSNGDDSTKANEPPQAPDVPTTTTTTTTPRTTTPTTDATEPTDDTIVLGNDTTTPSTVPTPRASGFIIDPLPEGLVAAGGFETSDSDVYTPASWFQVWASEDAAHTAGRWLAINVSDEGWNAPQPATAGTTRVELGGRPSMVTTEPNGVVTIAMGTDDDARIQLRAYGCTLDQISQLVGATSFHPDEAPTFAHTADAILDGLDLRISRSGGPIDVYGVIAYGDRSSSYASSDGRYFVEVSARRQQEDDLFATALLGDPSTDPAAMASAPEGMIDLFGRRVLVVDLGNVFLQWHDGDDTVTTFGNLPLEDLFAVVANTRRATEEEWNAQLQSRAPIFDDTDGGNTYVEPTLVEVGRGDSSSVPGVFVRMGTALSPSGQRPLSISHGNGTIQTEIAYDQNLPVTVFLDIDVTIIVAEFRSLGAMKKLRVSLPGRPSVIVPLVPLGDDGDYGAAYAFSEIAEFAVALVDADGTLIQEFDV